MVRVNLQLKKKKLITNEVADLTIYGHNEDTYQMHLLPLELLQLLELKLNR